MKAEIELPIRPQKATQHCETPSSQKENFAICKSSPSSYNGQSNAVMFIGGVGPTVDVLVELSSMILTATKTNNI